MLPAIFNSKTSLTNINFSMIKPNSLIERAKKFAIDKFSKKDFNAVLDYAIKISDGVEEEELNIWNLFGADPDINRNLFFVSGYSDKWNHYSVYDLKKLYEKVGFDETMRILKDFEPVFKVIKKMMPKYADAICYDEALSDEHGDCTLDYCEELTLENFKSRFTNSPDFIQTVKDCFYNCVGNWDAGYPYAFTFFLPNMEPIFMKISGDGYDKSYSDNKWTLSFHDCNFNEFASHSENCSSDDVFYGSAGDRFGDYIERVISTNAGFYTPVGNSNPELLENSENLLENFEDEEYED